MAARLSFTNASPGTPESLSKMKVYWNQKDIPALKGLSGKDREAVKRTVMPQVWRHWQVWVPLTAQIVGFAVFVLTAPRFPYRLPIVLLGIYITTKLAGLPLNHYLDHYLERRNRSGETDPSLPTPPSDHLT